MCDYFARLEPDTGSMHDPWEHIGRLWTNGDPYLAVDAALRSAWRGFSNDDYDLVVGLSWEDTSVPVGAGRGLLVGADGVVGDDSWMEVFINKSGRLAVVQASGPDYPAILARALAYPLTDDQDGDPLAVDSGQLAIFSAATDGTGRYSGPWVSPEPGPVPDVPGPPTDGVDPGLLMPVPCTRYSLKVRWYTRPDEDHCFARWLLIPDRLTTDSTDGPLLRKRNLGCVAHQVKLGSGTRSVRTHVGRARKSVPGQTGWWLRHDAHRCQWPGIECAQGNP